MSAPTYRQGRILWARLRAQSGKKVPHPAIIMNAIANDLGQKLTGK